MGYKTRELISRVKLYWAGLIFVEENTQTSYMITRFIFYGILGWSMEIFWTGMGSFLKGNWELSGVTYLWMFPIYGLAVFMEPIQDRMLGIPWYIRGLIYSFVILVIEYLTGWTLDMVLGSCPWDYTFSSPYHLNGYIRFDYIPVWFFVGLLLEKVHEFLDRIRL